MASRCLATYPVSHEFMKRGTILRLVVLVTAIHCTMSSPVGAQVSQKGKAKGPPVAAQGACQSKPAQHFTVDITGNASSTGRTYEGPLCVDVGFNPVVQFTQIEAVAATSVKGPDLSSVFLGGSGAAGVGVKKKIDVATKGATLPETLQAIELQAANLKALLVSLKSSYSAALRQQNTAIDGLSAMNKAMRMTNFDSVEASLRNQYLVIKPDLGNALTATKNFTPSDAPTSDGDVYLAEAQQLEDRLAHLPLEFVSGSAKPANAQECKKTMDTSWSDWYSVCKDAYYTPLKAELDSNLADAQLYTSAGDAATALKKQASIVRYWDKILTGMGLMTTMSDTQIKNSSLSGLYTHIDVPCDGLFNESVSTALNLVTLDYTPTLTGGDPTPKVQSAFVTIRCSTRFTLSAGVGFSTIEQKTYAIIPSSDGKGGTTNTFGTTSDSKITPVALAIANVRLREWYNHGVGVYGSLGVGGNLQTNASAAYFLPGVSFAFWRTMYVTLGAGIGSQSILTGGYKEGDPVPTGVTTIGAVTGSSHVARFAFAVTFTKP
jgi:hypothetical protein